MWTRTRRVLKKVLPKPVRTALRSAAIYTADSVHVMVHGRDEMTPPAHLHHVGYGDFHQVGKEFFDYFVRLGGLKPHESMLDIGCGVGRMAIPIGDYLKDGRYSGFDISPKAIEWCQSKITARYPNFQFEVADIYNGMYNPTGKYTADKYEFPYPDNTFDFAIMTSVLTHLLPADAENYIRQTFRVMKPNGRCLFTMFLINDESLGLIRKLKSSLDFQRLPSGVWTSDPVAPESAVGYDEADALARLKAVGFEVTKIHYGKWCGRSSYTSFQDLVLLRKP